MKDIDQASVPLSIYTINTILHFILQIYDDIAGC